MILDSKRNNDNNNDSGLATYKEVRSESYVQIDLRILGLRHFTPAQRIVLIAIIARLHRESEARWAECSVNDIVLDTGVCKRTVDAAVKAFVAAGVLVVDKGKGIKVGSRTPTHRYGVFHPRFWLTCETTFREAGYPGDEPPAAADVNEHDLSTAQDLCPVPFVGVNHAILAAKKLTHTQKLTLLVIQSHLHHKGKDKWVFPAVERIADLAGLSVNTVRDAITGLDDMQVIVIDHRHERAPAGSRSPSNRYAIRKPHLWLNDGVENCTHAEPGGIGDECNPRGHMGADPGGDGCKSRTNGCKTRGRIDELKEGDEEGGDGEIGRSAASPPPPSSSSNGLTHHAAATAAGQSRPGPQAADGHAGGQPVAVMNDESQEASTAISVLDFHVAAKEGLTAHERAVEAARSNVREATAKVTASQQSHQQAHQALEAAKDEHQYGWVQKTAEWSTDKDLESMEPQDREQVEKAKCCLELLSPYVDVCGQRKEELGRAQAEQGVASASLQVAEDRRVTAIVEHERQLVERVGSIACELQTPMRLKIELPRISEGLLKNLVEAPFESLPARNRKFSFDLFVENLGQDHAKQLLAATHRTSILLWGKPGTGKTTLASSIVRYFMGTVLGLEFDRLSDQDGPAQRIKNAIWSAEQFAVFPDGDRLRGHLANTEFASYEPDLNEQIRNVFDGSRTFDSPFPNFEGATVADRWADAITKIKVPLVLDDVLHESASRAAASAIETIIKCRYASQYPTIYTTNLTPDELSKRFGNAAADRLCEGLIIEIAGKSLRNA